MGSVAVMRAFFWCFAVGGIVALAASIQVTVRAQSASAGLVHLRVDGASRIATIGESFLCATLDWWPPEKCNYNSCPWHLNSLLNLNLDNPVMVAAIVALAPLRVRLGGTLQDHVVYQIGSPTEPCVPITVNTSDIDGFSGGCLPMQRWDILSRFFTRTGATVAFGLNCMYGKTTEDSWDSSNAVNFIQYTHDQGYPVTAWELGNELMGNDGVAEKASPIAYGSYVKQLRAIVDAIYPNVVARPLVAATDSFYDPGNPDFQQFLESSGPNVVNVVTRHNYNLGPGSTSTDALVATILDTNAANAEDRKYASFQALLASYPWATAWIGESGGAYNSGHEDVTDSFIMAFWYLDQMGLASKHNNQAFCRQALIGGHYGLLNAGGAPNPDYFAALLWKNLMGHGVLSANVLDSTDIRAYAHCQRDNPEGVTILILNYNRFNQISVQVNVSATVSATRQGSSEMDRKKLDRKKLAQVKVSNSRMRLGQEKFQLPRLEYHVTPVGGDIHSHAVLLNGRPLTVYPSGKISPLTPNTVFTTSDPVVLDPLTYAYVVFQDASVNACLSP